MKNIITTVLVIGSLFFLFFQNYYDDRIEEIHQQNTSRIDSINTYIDRKRIRRRDAHAREQVTRTCKESYG